ncbi:hypothetical protein BASA50_004668 [Batrachochytrium salamandrivorans]|uniref:Uncharacterized protein n=1 Tax=Batrachochytrium salamandrivorans TaxID=1357716 RepID=A0ABQ8FFB6_9FUNG|nr:hypothetical protein BASA50_004668 [Batrachochytrium salamandrivorans]
MRLSTGIILSILSANVFAIEHPNGAHSGSLLAPNYVYIKGEFDEDFYLNPNFSDDTGEGTTDSPTYDPNQDLGATGGKEDAHTDDDSDQEGSSFADASRGSSSQVLGRIRKELFRAKHGLGLLYRLDMAFAAFKQVWDHFGGREGHTIGWNAFRMHEYALKKSQEYKLLYKNSVESPFILKLPSSASNEQRKTYKRLQKEVHKSSKNHISAIVHAVDRTFREAREHAF